jgi:negative regulator of sigma E activity
LIAGRTVARRLALVAITLALGGCSATRLAYDNADTVLRFMASSYLDLDAEQSEDLKPRIVRFQAWHRANELPVYAGLLRSASQRAAQGITAEDVAWGLANVRARYRRFLAEAAEDGAPVLATLSLAQHAVLEKKFAENNEKYAKEFLSADDRKRRRAQSKRMLERFRDFTGDLAPDQEARIESFVLAHERHTVLRFEDRQRWQRDIVAALKEHEPRELGRRLAEMANRPELRRSEEFLREDRRWGEDLGQLIVDLDRSLSAKQRAKVVSRLSGYAEDFSVLAGRKKEAA